MYHKVNEKNNAPPSYETINKLIIDTNKKYFYIKNNYHDEIEELQESLGTPVDLFELVDQQHLIIRELDHIVKNLFSDLSFRKLIIERKDRVLKDMNQVIINRFIDKIYRYELIIEQLKKENSVLNRINHNNISGNIINKARVPINVIAPKTNNEYNGAIAFFNNPVKNIQKFINIKNVNYNKIKSDGVKSLKHTSHKANKTLDASCSLIKTMKSSSTRTLPPKKQRLEPNSHQRKGNSIDNIITDSNFNKTCNLSGYSICSLSDISSFTNTATIAKNRSFAGSKPKPTRVTKTLLGKSYEVLQKYENKKKKRGISQQGYRRNIDPFS